MTKDTLELWLVRHGRTVGNDNGHLVGWNDTPLTPQGETQARALHPRLAAERFEGVWSSDLSRAVMTARLAYGEPTTDQRLREIHFGDLEGDQWEDVEVEYRDALTGFEQFHAPNGEDLVGFKARIDNFIEGLNRGRHLIFTHGGVVRMLTQKLGITRFVPNGCLVIVDWLSQQVLSCHPPLETWVPRV